MTVATSPLHRKPAVRAFFRIVRGERSAKVVFQYNPTELRRELKPRAVGGDPNASASSSYYTAPPVETFQLRLEINAEDQPGSIDSAAPAQHGIRPLLNALELSLYPAVSDIETNRGVLATGALEIGSYGVPLLVFHWGEVSVPVRITSYRVTEQEFSKSLAPLRATCDVSLQVVTAADVRTDDPAYAAYIQYQTQKETVARSAYSDVARLPHEDHSLLGAARGAVDHLASAAAGAWDDASGAVSSAGHSVLGAGERLIGGD